MMKSILLILLLCVTVQAATYTIGSDPGDDYTTHTAMNTGETVAAGDIISFRKGETFRETVTIEASGSAGNPILYTSHGTGVNPIINGADIMTTWVADGGSYVKTGVTTEPLIVIYDGLLLDANDGGVNTVDANEWDWDANSLWVNVGEDADVGVLEAGQRDRCVTSPNRTNCTLTGLHLTGANVYGCFLELPDSWIITDCTIDNIGSDTSGAGLFLNGNTFLSGRGNNVVRNNTFLNIWNDAIFVRRTDNDTISGNTITNIFGSVGDGVQTEASQNYTISNNTITRESDSTKGCIICQTGSNGTITGNICLNGAHGILCDDADSLVERNICGLQVSVASAGGLVMGDVAGGTDGVTWRNNISYGCNYGLVAFGAVNKQTNLKIYNNTIFDAKTRGLFLRGVEAIVKNNIIHSDSASSAVLRYDSIASSSGSIISNNNCIFPEGTAFIHFDGTDYNTLATYQAGESQDSASISQDPQFVDADNDNFHLQGNSPCLGIGRYPDEFPLGRSRYHRYGRIDNRKRR